MPTETTTIVRPAAPLFDEARLAIAGFLARYSGATRTSYATDLRQYFAWCAQHNLEVFAARRGHIELYARTMEERGLARSTIGRRLSTVAGFYRFAVIDGAIDASPAEYVRRLKIDTESTTLGLDRMELGAFIAQGTAGSVVDQALACLLGLLGLRISEALNINVEHLGIEGVTAPSPCSARARSSPSSRFHLEWLGQSTWPPLSAPAGRSYSAAPESG
ncbi:MAG: site-specific integrase [Actinomycetota bacterium]|nr:site-specific integrase [Actinomycetota bacterium]